jgi:hypothetical protein
MRYILAAMFLACIPAANWMIGNIGTVCVPEGPCLVPVFPGIMAPSGVLVIGLALVLRSLLQEAAGRRWVVGCIGVGAALSAAVAPPALVVASAVAFLCGELADWSVYSPLRRHGWTVALVASGLVGSVVDSALFLGLAFGSLGLMTGQIIGKLWASLFVALVISNVRRLAGEQGEAP